MTYTFNHFMLDTNNFTLMREGQVIEVEPRVFDVIVYLIENNNKVVTRDELFQTVWNGRDVLDATLSNHIKIARQVLGDNGQLQHTIKTIHGRGYQFIALVDDKPIELETTHSKNRYYVLVALALITLIFVFFQFKSNTKQNFDTPVIAVLPLTNNKPSSDSDYFSIAITDQIIGHLNYLHNISVRPSASIRKYINTIDPVSVGKELEVDYILTGNYLKVNNTIRLNIELIEIKSSQLIWRSKQIEVENKNAFELQDIVTQRVINALKVKFSTNEIQRIEKDIPQSALAYEYYLRGIAYPYTNDGNRLAIEMLKKSLDLDENYALTYVKLGDRIRRYKQFSLQDMPFQKAKDYYLKALRINPELLNALSYLAMYYTETNQIKKAIELANKMVVINPNHADTHFTLGYIYRYAGLVDLAIKEMEKAVKLDAHNPKYRSLIGTYSGNGNYHKALKMTELYETSPFTLGWKGLMYRRLGDNKKALEYFNHVIKEDKNGLWANVATVFKSYILGNTQQGLVAVEKLSNAANSDGETLYYLSSYYALLGDKENAIITLKKAIDAGYFNYPFMVSNSYFTTLENDGRFKKLLERALTKHSDFKEMLFIQ